MRQLELLALLTLQGRTDPFTQLGKLLLLVGKCSVIGDRHRLAIERQALTTAGDNLQRALRVPAIRLLDVQPLFGLGNFRALATDRLQSRGVLLLGERQAFLPRFEAQLPLFDALISHQQQALPALVVGRQLPGLSLPMRPVVGQLGEPRLVLAARIPPVADLGFQPCNLGIGRKEVTLCRMHAVAGGKMSFARLLETSLEITQGRVPGFEIGRRLFDLARQPFTLRLRFIAPQQPEQLLLACQLVAVFTILASDTGLTLEALHLGPEFEANVFYPRQVLACVGRRFSVSLRRSL
jgi:hypothetical protein